jgi:hypothetical protein
MNDSALALFFLKKKMSITVDCRRKVWRLKQKPLQRLLPQEHALCLVADLDATDKIQKTVEHHHVR